jgi:alcohol dehydrogenase
MVRDSWGFGSAQQTYFGSGSVRKVGQIAKKLGGKHALIVTDKMICAAGLLDPVKQPLLDAGLEVTVFDGSEPEPAIRVADACVAAAREAKADLLVALGGGSNMDVAKAAAVILTHGGTCRDYFGEFKVPGPIMPVIAIPTTSGTSSEVSPNTILNDEEKNLKIGMADFNIRPAVALIDPVLTLSCPPKPTASAGIDALCHAIESYTVVDYKYIPTTDDVVAHGKNPLSDCLALEAIRLISGSLRLAVLQGNNLEAREQMALGAYISGLAFTNSGVAGVHALAYPVGAATHAPHGVVNGLLLPYVMEYNIPARPAEFAMIAAAMGEEIEGLTDFEAAEMSVEAVKSLERDCGLPTRLSEIGVQEKDIRGMAEAGIGITRLLRANPRTPSVDDLEKILRNAL